MVILAGGNVQAQEFQSVTNLSNLEELVNQPWTNTTILMPPGNFPYTTDLGVMSYQDGFPPEFLSTLIPLTNSEVETFTVVVIETNTTPRQRFYLNSEGVAAHTTTVSMAGYPSNSIVATYGAVPSYLTGTNLTEWFDERDPIRQKVTLTLLSQSNAAAYYAAITNALVFEQYTETDTNTVNLMAGYSNDIAFVKTSSREGGVFEYYLHAPTNIARLSLFVSTNLMDSSGRWSFPATLNHSSDPLHGVYMGAFSPLFFAAGDPSVDSDNDGLSDCLEIYLFGTDPNNADSDNDGVPDGAEVYIYGCNPLLSSSDGSGMLDGEKIGLGLSPTIFDTDGDGAGDADEKINYFTDPKNPDTDNDGLIDGAEISAHTYPRFSDTDGDGLSDKQEIDLGTNPLLADSDGDDIDDKYEHDIGWNPCDPSNASQDDDGDGLTNLQEYQWSYSPKYANTHDYRQRLIVVPAGANGKPKIADTIQKLIALDEPTKPARLWVRPLGAGTNTLPQQLHFNATSGFYINGVESTSISSPIAIPAVKTNIEFKITSTSAAWGTWMAFWLTDTNNYESSFCRATVYSPKISKTSFSVDIMYATNYAISSANYTNVDFGKTGSLYYCQSVTSDKPKMWFYPYQSPDAGYGIPTFIFTDLCRFDVDYIGQYSGMGRLTNTMNAYDYRSGYGYPGNARQAAGASFNQGRYCLKTGVDMNGNGELNDDEMMEWCNLTVFRTELEPIICDDYSNSIVNPSGIKVGGTAQYKVTVEPSSILDSEITWSSTNFNIYFPNGNTGRSVTVGATGMGLTQLKVDIAGYKKAPPSITVKGLTNSTVAVSFYIICDDNGTPAVSPETVTSALSTANEIYKQVAMNFAQNGSITYITNSALLDIPRESNLFPYIYPNLWDVTSCASNTGGLEVYFVRQIGEAYGLADTRFWKGIAIASNAPAPVMAHEIGHACRLSDIYDNQNGVYVSMSELPQPSWEAQDWNNGPSPQYYAPGRTQVELLQRLLMFGEGGVSSACDIPLGKVYGVGISSGTNYVRGLIKVGLDNAGYPMDRNPVSQ